ncbi:MAG: xanthine dehydrogenase family protein molybdopterin-binding subunit [Frankiales bacterium]|nr:xanthine dehydrogenase family protein molybdopterin-binding subunit [Frankiales bacterium]
MTLTPDAPASAPSDPAGQPTARRGPDLSRRRFLAYVIAAPTVVTAVRYADASPLAGGPALQPIPSAPGAADEYDLNDLLTDSTRSTANMITVTMHKDGTASFALPRVESGQGITTSTAMLIAEELDLPISKVHVTLADARPELKMNQFTAGSNTTISTYQPIRTAAAAAKQQMLLTAARELGVPAGKLTTRDGIVHAPDGRTIPYADLATRAAARTTQQIAVTLKPASAFTVVGKPHGRVDALEAVTGRKKFTMDHHVRGALPTMICRPPTIKGTVKRVNNLARVKKMPGVTHVGVISTGVAVRARTFGQCIDAIRALKVTWNPGTVDKDTDDTILAELKANERPFGAPATDPLAQVVDESFAFYWKSNSALEPNTAIADVRKTKATIWSCLQAPIFTQKQVADLLGLSVDKVTVHVMPGGGAFGRRMFSDVALEAAEASKLFGVPVKLMWHRTDEFRAGRMHPLAISHVRATYSGGSVVSFEQRHTSFATDWSMGFGEPLSASMASTPPNGQGDQGYSQGVWNLTVNVPYNFGQVDHAVNEIRKYDDMHTGSVRNLYNADAAVARELAVDKLAAAMKVDRYAFRTTFLKDDQSRAVLHAAAKAARWGRHMPKGTAQGIAFHTEYHGKIACVAEIDCRPHTVHRKMRQAVTGPRVTKVVIAVDVGLPINPRGIEAQMMGGAMDAIGQILTESLHLHKGYFLEGSWDDYYYTRQWNVPAEVKVIVMPASSTSPGGVGEFGIAVTKSAVACALAHALGKTPAYFPINHKDPLPFKPFPTVPPIPQSPRDGLHDNGS